MVRSTALRFPVYVRPLNIDRKTFIEIEGVVQPAPAPRFSRTQGEIQGPAAKNGENTKEVLSAWNFSEQEIGELQAAGAI